MQLRNSIYEEKDLYEIVPVNKKLNTGNGIFVYGIYLNILHWFRSFFN